MTMKKTITLVIIALFISLSFSPMSSAQVKENTMIPVQVKSLNTNGLMGYRTIFLPRTEVLSLIGLMNLLRRNRDLDDNIINKISDLFNRDTKLFQDIGLLSKLPGNPIVSYGEGRQKYLARYHGRVQFKKIFSMWNYPGDVGATIIWGDGLTSIPTQVLLQKQLGFMIGFVGVYIYIPPFLEDMNSKTLFFGSSLFAWGISA